VRPAANGRAHRPSPRSRRRASTSIAWAFLILSGLADVVWAVATKYSDGQARLGWTAVSAVALLAFLALLTRALKALPLGTAYAVGSLLAGLLFGAAMGAARLATVVAIVGGIVALEALPA
jgi:quaternary ammonium compound-resistance protein SugE